MSHDVIKWKNVIKRIYLVALITIGFHNVGECGAPPIDRMKSSTVRILCVNSEGKGNTGSGFITGGGNYVVSNWHVVSCTAQGGEASIALSRSKRIEVIDIDRPSGKDLAILKLARSSEKPAVTFATSKLVKAGLTRVYVMGFPGAADDLIDEEGVFEVKITDGIISAFVRSEAIPSSNLDETDLYQTNAGINPGNSGGPLFNEYGHVIGINVWKSLVPVRTTTGEQIRVTEGDDIGWAIRADELLPELDRLRISYRQANAITIFFHELDSRTVIPIIALLVAVISLYITSSQLRRQAVIQTVTRFGETVSSRLGKKHSPASPATENKGILIGSSGHFARREFAFEAGELILGRDASKANVVFPAEQREISKLHARVTCDASRDSFIVEDLGSSGGTFLANGKRIKSGRGMRLSSGASFYLVSPAQSFKLGLFPSAERNDAYSPQPNNSKGFVVGLCGEFNQNEFPLQEGKLVFGRDPRQASVVFSKKSREISRRHAGLKYDPRRRLFLLEDLGSSKGTFLASGEKLRTHRQTSLRAGDTFYLASSKHTFQLIER